MEDVEQPRFFAWRGRCVDGEDFTHRSFIFVCELPYNELVVFSMSVMGSEGFQGLYSTKLRDKKCECSCKANRKGENQHRLVAHRHTGMLLHSSQSGTIQATENRNSLENPNPNRHRNLEGI